MTIFNQIRDMFPFVDASQLVNQLTILEGQDKVIKAGLEKVQFQVGIRVLVFNLKRVVPLDSQKIDLLFSYRMNLSLVRGSR